MCALEKNSNPTFYHRDLRQKFTIRKTIYGQTICLDSERYGGQKEIYVQLELK